VKLSEYRASQCEQAMKQFLLLHRLPYQITRLLHTMKTINKLTLDALRFALVYQSLPHNERALIKRAYIQLINKKVVNHG